VKKAKNLNSSSVERAASSNDTMDLIALINEKLSLLENYITLGCRKCPWAVGHQTADFLTLF
jgi:hypothetical protein